MQLLLFEKKQLKMQLFRLVGGRGGLKGGGQKSQKIFFWCFAVWAPTLLNRGNIRILILLCSMKGKKCLGMPPMVTVWVAKLLAYFLAI